jgi:hypothetical protein
MGWNAGPKREPGRATPFATPHVGTSTKRTGRTRQPISRPLNRRASRWAFVRSPVTTRGGQSKRSSNVAEPKTRGNWRMETARKRMSGDSYCVAERDVSGKCRS